MSRAGSRARAKLIDACATIARLVSYSPSAAAHTVQLMLRNPEFRDSAIRTAQARVDTVDVTAPTEAQRVAEQDVRAAAYQLRGYAGRAI